MDIDNDNIEDPILDLLDGNITYDDVYCILKKKSKHEIIRIISEAVISTPIDMIYMIKPVTDSYEAVISTPIDMIYMINPVTDSYESIVDRFAIDSLKLAMWKKKLSMKKKVFIETYIKLKDHLLIDICFDDIIYLASENKYSTNDHIKKIFIEFVKYYLDTTPNFVINNIFLFYIFENYFVELLQVISEFQYDKNIIYDTFAIYQERSYLSTIKDDNQYYDHQRKHGRQINIIPVHWDVLKPFLLCLIENDYDMDKLATMYMLVNIDKSPQVIGFFADNNINISHKYLESCISTDSKIYDKVNAISKITSDPYITAFILTLPRY